MEPILDIVDLNPGEIRSREHDWGDNVVAGTAIQGAVDITVTDLSTGADATSGCLVAKNQSSNVTTFSLRRPAGDTGSYGVTLQMQRNDGDIFRDFYLLGSEGTVYDLIASAYESLNIVGVDAIPSSSQQRRGLRMLNSMLASWSAELYRVRAMVAENFSLVAADGEYTIGSGGNFNTTRPKDIASAFIRYGSRDQPLSIIGKETYDSFTDKFALGPPLHLYYEPTSPLGKVFLYPMPDTTYELWIRGQKEIGGYSSLMAAHGLERDFEDAIKWNLAMQMAGALGVPLAGSIAVAATQSINRLENLRSGDVPFVLDGGLLVV